MLKKSTQTNYAKLGLCNNKMWDIPDLESTQSYDQELFVNMNLFYACSLSMPPENLSKPEPLRCL